MDHGDEIRTLRSEPGGRHYNCAQSLLVPFAPEIGLEKGAADALGAFLGAGMMHGTVCGTLSAALMILGRMHGAALAGRRERHDPQGELRRPRLRDGAEAR